MQGWAVNCLGHSPDVIADALVVQSAALLTPSPAFYNAPSLKLANALVEKSCFDQVFFANSGAEANEGAIKLARKYGSLHKGGAHVGPVLPHRFQHRDQRDTGAERREDVHGKRRGAHPR